MSAVDRALTELLNKNGLPTGTSLENKVTWRLHRYGALDCCQYRVGKYRLDFAWPSKMIGLEADGPTHWQPDVAVKDVNRSTYLRSVGWLMFRVDDTTGTLDEQVSRVAHVVNAVTGYDSYDWARVSA